MAKPERNALGEAILFSSEQRWKQSAACSPIVPAFAESSKKILFGKTNIIGIFGPSRGWFQKMKIRW
jgi:hypothetical protein